MLKTAAHAQVDSHRDSTAIAQDSKCFLICKVNPLIWLQVFPHLPVDTWLSEMRPTSVLRLVSMCTPEAGTNPRLQGGEGSPCSEEA